MRIVDRNVLKYEPDIFKMIEFTSQTYLKDLDCSFDGSTVSVLSENANFALIQPLDVILINNVPYEVIERVSLTSIKVSMLRQTTECSAIQGNYQSNSKLTHKSFRLQGDVAFRSLLQHISHSKRIAANQIEIDDALEDAVAIGTLSLIFGAASSVQSDNRPIYKEKSLYYAQVYQNYINNMIIEIDCNNDGHYEEELHFSKVNITRV